MSEKIFFAMEIIGTIAFAMSGAFVAIEKKMDILGVGILGITTAVGGGIIRDTLIGVTPPSSLVDPMYAFIALAVSLIVFIPGIRKLIDLDSKIMVFIDAIGLGAFTVIGCNAALRFDNIWLQLFLGVLTGVGGGVVRDIFAAEKPMIFVRHFYAVASLVGAIAYSILLPYSNIISAIVGITIIVILRMLAAKYKWHLPKA